MADLGRMANHVKLLISSLKICFYLDLGWGTVAWQPPPRPRWVRACYYLTRTKHDCTSTQCIFNLNVFVTGHKQDTVGVSPRKSAAKAAVSIGAV